MMLLAITGDLTSITCEYMVFVACK